MPDDPNVPNQNANKSKAEGERWSSESDTVEERDRSFGDQPTGGEGGGITNRPVGEEQENQAALPKRGESRDGAHAGHGDRPSRGTDR